MARQDELIEIEISNFHEYNPRSDRKRHSWFRFDNTFLMDPKYGDLNSNEVTTFLGVLSLVSHSNRSEVTKKVQISCRELAKLCRVRYKTLQNSLSRLQEKQLLTAKSVTDRCPTLRTLRTLRTNDTGCTQAKRKGAKPTKKKPPSVVSELLKIRRDLHNEIHGCDPIQNAQVNGILSQFVGAVGKDDAPGLLEFFYRYPNNFYKTKAHDLKLLSADKSKLHTEYKRKAPILPDARSDAFKGQLKKLSRREEILRRAEHRGGK